jgi:hypothetical protein
LDVDPRWAIISVWESREIRVPRVHESAGLNLTTLTEIDCGVAQW